MNTIPLVKGNTQEEINTSLIALKKALDEINSSSGKTDASVQSQIKQINELIENINTQIEDLQPVDTVTSGNMHSVTSNAVASMFNTDLNDDDFVNITSQVTASLGVQIVNVRRSNNIVIMKLEGTYTGNPTLTTQQLVRSLPVKYTPRLEQGGLPLFGFNASQISTVSRGSVTSDGQVQINECNWNNGTGIVTTIMYYAG
jgi:hypothetical protein